MNATIQNSSGEWVQAPPTTAELVATFGYGPHTMRHPDGRTMVLELANRAGTTVVVGQKFIGGAA